MYTDPFDFISTRSNPVPILEDASQSIRLMPYIPADFNLNPSIAQGTTNAKNLSLHALIASDLAKIPNNAPAYDYTTQQEKRYDNPYLQYTPSNILGTDTEDIYGRIQGTPAQFANSIIKTWANFGGTFLSTFLSAPKTFDLSREGKPFEEDDSFATVQNWLTSLEDKLPNYYTEKERNRTDWINALPFSGGAMNFWGDKVIKNIGFSMGALSAGLTIDAAITAALTPTTGGAATPTAVLNGINRIRSLSPKLFTAFRNLAKGAEQTDNIIDAAKLTGNFSKGLELSRLSRIPTAAKYATVSYLTAQGEAFVEGYHTWLDTKKDLLEDAIYRKETDEATMNEIEDRANKAGKWTTALNLPIITFTNLVQFPNLLMGRNVFQKNVNDFVKTQLKTEGIDRGVQALSTYSTKRALRKEGWEAIKDIVSEGFEEGAQYHIGSSVHDYYSNRLNPYLKADLLGFVMDNIPETLTDDQFWKEAGIGGLTGFLMGSPASVNRLRKGRERADKTGVRLNNVYDRFNSAVKQYSSTIDLNNPNSNETIASHDALYSSVHDSVKFGTYDSFIQSLEDLKELDLEEYNKGFQQDFKTPMERDAFVDSMIQDAIEMKADVEKVNSFYQKNPYTTNPMIQRIKKALNPKDQIDLNSIQENLFEDYKEVVARNESLLRKTNGLVLNLKNNLRLLGVKNESIDYLANLAQSPKGFKDYLKFKEAQIKDLQRQVLYYEELAKSVTDVTPELNPAFQLRQAKQNLEQTLAYYDKVYAKLNELEKDPKNTEVQNSLRDDVILEETTPEQRNKYNLDKAKAYQVELEKNENLRKVVEKEANNPEKLPSEILKANERYTEESEPLTEVSPITPNVNPLNNFEVGKDVVIDGKRYTVESLDLDNNKATVKDSNNITFETDGKKVTPIDTKGVIAQTELPFEDNQPSLQDKIDDIERRRQEETAPILQEIEKIEKEIEEIEKASNTQGAYDFSASSNSGKWNSANNELLSLVQNNKRAFTIYKLLIGDATSFKEIVDSLNERGVEIPYTERMRIADETMSAEETESALDSYNNSANKETEKSKKVLSENNLEENKEYSVEELIDKFPLSGVEKVIYDLIKDVVKKLNIKVKFSLTRIPDGFHGFYSPATGEILIHPSTITTGSIKEVLIHEVVHSLTTKIISRVEAGITTGLTPTQINAVKGLIRLFESVKADNNLENKYPVKDVFEFIAHLTNESFVKELESKDKNFLQKVVDFILDILGITNANELSKKYLLDIVSDGVFLQENGIIVLHGEYKGEVQGSKETSRLQLLKDRLRELKQQLNKINAKYDAELAALEQPDKKTEIENDLQIKLADYFAFSLSATGSLTWEEILKNVDSNGNPIPEEDRVTIKNGYDLGDDYFAIEYSQKKSQSISSFQIFKKGNQRFEGKAFINTANEFRSLSPDASDVVKSKIDKLKDIYFNGLSQPDPVEEYLSPEVNLPEPVPVDNNVTRGTREFTIDQIQNYSGTYWIKSESDFSDSSFVYAIKQGRIERHKLVATQDGVRIGEKSKAFSSKELRSFVNEDNTFVQVLSKGEVEVPIVESVTKDVSADIKKFLGSKNTSLYKTIEDQINKGKIKLECQ